MRFRIFTEIFVQNPWFSILASYGQELAPATASYGLAGPDLAWWADNSMRIRVPYVRTVATTRTRRLVVRYSTVGTR